MLPDRKFYQRLQANVPLCTLSHYVPTDPNAQSTMWKHRRAHLIMYNSWFLYESNSPLEIGPAAFRDVTSPVRRQKAMSPWEGRTFIEFDTEYIPMPYTTPS